MDDDMIDLHSADIVEIQIRHDGKVVWVNVNGRCKLRICNVKAARVVVDDARVREIVEEVFP